MVFVDDAVKVIKHSIMSDWNLIQSQKEAEKRSVRETSLPGSTAMGDHSDPCSVSRVRPITVGYQRRSGNMVMVGYGSLTVLKHVRYGSLIVRSDSVFIPFLPLLVLSYLLSY